MNVPKSLRTILPRLCRGRDPRFRRSTLASVATHLLVILVIPWLWSLRGCIDPYKVPFGSGDFVVEYVRIVRPRRKPRKTFILNPQSAIIWQRPEIDDSDALREVLEETEQVYQASRDSGEMGAGKGKTGGWPEGSEGGKLRFIRLQYNGPDWDDGMDAGSAADINFLNWMRRHPSVSFPVAAKGEANRVELLAKYDKGFAPPFVYMTGSSHIRMGGSNVKVLREYLLGGGMLIADAGSARWHRSFIGFIRQVFPDKTPRTIADDDPIFQFPYAFPNGPPPLWHHGGRKALGIKHKGRWTVFYFPGDMNDAWKTGHSGIDPRLARRAFHLGYNLVHYAFTHYLEQTRKYRK